MKRKSSWKSRGKVTFNCTRNNSGAFKSGGTWQHPAASKWEETPGLLWEIKSNCSEPSSLNTRWTLQLSQNSPGLTTLHINSDSNNTNQKTRLEINICSCIQAPAPMQLALPHLILGDKNETPFVGPAILVKNCRHKSKHYLFSLVLRLISLSLEI